MADFFVDHGAYGSSGNDTNTNRIGLDNPTWGKPQDGDGALPNSGTPGPSPTASTATITLNAQPAANDTLIICGITLTAIATAPAAGSKNFQIGADIQTTANNIAACINACTDTTISTNVSAATPQMRNMFFARSLGVNSGIVANAVEIMARIGSKTLNQADNSYATITTSATWAGSAANLPAIVQLAGGQGGCWGWLINPALIGGGSSIAISGYGIGVAKPYVLPVGVATLTYTDYVYARTGNGKAIDMLGNSWARANVGFPLNLVADTNTKWVGDSGTGVIKVILKCPASQYIYFRTDYSSSSGNPFSVSAIMKGGFKLEYDMSNSSSNFIVQVYGIARFFNIEISEKLGTVPAGGSTVQFGGLSGTLYMISCKFGMMGVRSQLPNTFMNMQSQTAFYNIEDCDFSFNFSGVQSVVDAQPILNIRFFNGVIRFANNRFTTGGTTKLRWFYGVNEPNQWQMIFEKNSGVLLNSAGTGVQSVGFWQRSGSAFNSLSLTSPDQGYSFRHERTSGIVDWDYESATYPYLSAVQPDGTPYSVRMEWFNFSYVTPFAPFGSGKVTKLNRLSTGARTITVEMLLDPTLTVDNRMMDIHVDYVDVNGTPRRETTYMNPAYALAPSSAPWNYRSGNYTNYISKKMLITTSQPVLANTEISVEVMLCNAPTANGAGGNKRLFFDPEFVLA